MFNILCVTYVTRNLAFLCIFVSFVLVLLVVTKVWLQCDALHADIQLRLGSLAVAILREL